MFYITDYTLVNAITEEEPSDSLPSDEKPLDFTVTSHNILALIAETEEFNRYYSLPLSFYSKAEIAEYTTKYIRYQSMLQLISKSFI